jgi:hypothetical protein
VDRLEHQSHAPNDFIELIVTKLRICLAKIRPGVDVVDHQLQVIAMNVVVEDRGAGRIGWCFQKVTRLARPLLDEKPAEILSRRAFDNLTKLFNPQNLMFKSAVKKLY